MGLATEKELPLAESGIEQFRWSSLGLPPRAVEQLPLAGDLPALRRQVRALCPEAPGIYGFLDLAGHLIYVGYSAKLSNRLITYFQESAPPRKEQRISSRACLLVWQDVGHAFAAMHRELELIQQFQPRLNVRGRSKQQKIGYLYLTTEDAPRFDLRKQIPRDTRHWWGPLWIDNALRNAVDQLNRFFRLPDCPSATRMAFVDERLLFPEHLHTPCLRAETGSCLAPCAGTCSHDRYFAQLQQARDLLNGKSDEPLIVLEKRIAEAAQAQRFEQAANLRDLWQPLVQLQKRLQAAREPCFQNGVYQIRIGRRKVWFLLAGSVVEGCVAEPLSQKRIRRFLDQINQQSAVRVRQSNQRNRLASQIVNLWFRTNPDEIDRVSTFTQARHYFREQQAKHRTRRKVK